MNTALSIVALALSLLTSVVAVTAVIVQMRTNMGTLSEQHKKQEAREDAAAKDVADMFVLLKSFIAEQTVTNKMVNLALESTIKKLEQMENRTVESSAIVELLTKVLERKSVELKGLSIEGTP
jgi:hypothetical protein